MLLLIIPMFILDNFNITLNGTVALIFPSSKSSTFSRHYTARDREVLKSLNRSNRGVQCLISQLLCHIYLSEFMSAKKFELSRADVTFLKLT